MSRSRRSSQKHQPSSELLLGTRYWHMHLTRGSSDNVTSGVSLTHRNLPPITIRGLFGKHLVRPHHAV